MDTTTYEPHPGGYVAMDQLRADAAAVLRTCTPTTLRATVAWAAGAYHADHAIEVSQLLAGQPCGGEHGAITVPGRGKPYRDLEHHHKRGMWLTEGKQVLHRFAWAEIAAPLRTLPPAVVDVLRAALSERRARIQTPEMTRAGDAWWQSPAGVLQNERWAEIEDHCYQLGAAAWLKCRPAEEPTDLLELLAAGGGA